MQEAASDSHGGFADRSGGAEGSEAPADATDASRRSRTVVAGIIGMWLLVLALLTLTDHVAVVWKSLVLPVLLVGALLAGRLKAFVYDWAIFVGAVMLFDAGRGFIYGLILHFELPVWMGYAIDTDRALFGDPLLIIRLQELVAPGGQDTFFARVLGMIYGSHFVAFLVFGMAVWMLRPEHFGRFKAGMVLNMYLGLLGYLLIPTVPPWMAAGVYRMPLELVDVGGNMFRTALPTVTAAFEINPIAAMPSLHCAFPTFMTLLCFRYFRAAAIPFALYTCCVYLSTMVLAHHYVVDVLGGIALALVSYTLVYHVPPMVRHLRLDTVTDSAKITGLALRLRVLVVLLMLAVMAGISVVGKAMAKVPGRLDPNTPTADFIERELAGRSVVEPFYRAMLALEQRDHRAALRHIEGADKDIPKKHRTFAYAKTALVAHGNGDFATAVKAVNHLEALDRRTLLVMADSLVRSGDRERGHTLLDAYIDMKPDDPVALGLRQQLLAEFGTPTPTPEEAHP